MTWLDCETRMEGDVKLTTTLKCQVCTEFRDRIFNQKSFSDKWISGTDKMCTTNVVDDAKSEPSLGNSKPKYKV